MAMALMSCGQPPKFCSTRTGTLHCSTLSSDCCWYKMQAAPACHKRINCPLDRAKNSARFTESFWTASAAGSFTGLPKVLPASCDCEKKLRLSCGSSHDTSTVPVPLEATLTCASDASIVRKYGDSLIERTLSHSWPPLLDAR